MWGNRELLTWRLFKWLAASENVKQARRKRGMKSVIIREKKTPGVSDEPYWNSKATNKRVRDTCQRDVLGLKEKCQGYTRKSRTVPRKRQIPEGSKRKKSIGGGERTHEPCPCHLSGYRKKLETQIIESAAAERG